MDLNTALMESITSMSEYFVAANTRTSFTDLAESANNSLGPPTGPSNQNNNLPTSQNNHQTFTGSNNSPGTMHKHQLGTPINPMGTHHQMQNHHHANNNNNHNQHSENNANPNNNNNLPIHHSSATLCNQNHHYHNHHNHNSHSSSSGMQSRLSQPTRTQIPIHCYIEQLDACADMLSYQSPLNDNDLFSTKDPSSTTSNQLQAQISNNHPHLHQSKLALESVTNCNGSNLSSLTNHHSSSLFNDNDPIDQTDNNDLDGVDTNLDHINTDSPLSIHPPQVNASTITSNDNSIQQPSNSICGDSIDHRQSTSYYDNTHHFHSCKETYVIVTSNVLYIDLVRTVLLQLGYSAMDLINAKGKYLCKLFISFCFMMADCTASDILQNPLLARKGPGRIER